MASAILAGLALPAQAQDAAPVLTQGFAPAQAPEPKRAWKITPRLTVSETLTDNIGLTATGQRSEQTTELAPGISIQGETARFKGNLDYALHGLFYAQDSTRNETQQSMNARATLEAIENWLYLDAVGMISQQDISAFGTRSTSNASVNTNRTETSRFQFSPYVRGRLANYANYELRYRKSSSRADSNLAADTDIDDALLSIEGGIGRSRLGWQIESTWNSVDYSLGRTTDAERLRAFLIWQAAPQLKMALIGGSEKNNYLSLNQERKTTTGLSLDWTPNERTRVSMLKESRFFGNGHNLSINYRLPLLALAYSDSRDVTTLPEQLQRSSLSATALVDSLLSSRYPDPTLRAEEVTRFFQTTGLSPTSVYEVGFLAAQVFVERQRRLSLVAYGARNALTLSAAQSEKISQTPMAGILDDFSLSPTIRERSLSASWAYRLSSLSVLNLSLARRNAQAVTTSNLDTRQRNFQLDLSSRVGKRTTASLAWRRTLFDSLTNPYAENQVVGTLNFLF